MPQDNDPVGTSIQWPDKQSKRLREETTLEVTLHDLGVAWVLMGLGQDCSCSGRHTNKKCPA